MWGFFAHFCGNQIYVTVLLKNVGSICPLRHVEALIQSNAEKCNADSLICALSGWLEIKWSRNVTETFPDLSHCRQFKPPLRTIQACVCWIHNTADHYFLKRGSTAGRTFTPCQSSPLLAAQIIFMWPLAALWVTSFSLQLSKQCNRG